MVLWPRDLCAPAWRSLSLPSGRPRRGGAQGREKGFLVFRALAPQSRSLAPTAFPQPGASLGSRCARAVGGGRGRREARRAGRWGRGDRGLSRPGRPRRGPRGPEAPPTARPSYAAVFLSPALCPRLPPRSAPRSLPRPVRGLPSRARRAGGGAGARQPERRRGNPAARGNEPAAVPGSEGPQGLVSFEGRRNCVVKKVPASYPFLPTSRPAPPSGPCSIYFHLPRPCSADSC